MERIGVVLAGAVALASCGGVHLGLPPANPDDGYGIVGYVGQGTSQAAPDQKVVLMGDGKLIDTVVTDWAGKYKFYPLEPGDYVVKVGKFSLPVVLSTDHQRLDIDLTAPGGKMDYVAAAAKEAQKGAKGSTKTLSGPNDKQLMQQMAGHYWGFSGVSGVSTGGGGTERNYYFCPGGRFSKQQESAYYGTTHDQYGDEEMSWGTVGSSGSGGSWKIQGDTDRGTIRAVDKEGGEYEWSYQRIDHQCLKFNGTTLCRKGPCG